MREEDRLQKDIVKHLHWRGVPGLLFAHIHNNAKTGREGRHMREMGRIPGVPDMIYALPGGVTIWHEIKTKKGRPSTVQKDFHEKLQLLGHRVIVTYGKDDALEQLKERGVIR